MVLVYSVFHSISVSPPKPYAQPGTLYGFSLRTSPGDSPLSFADAAVSSRANQTTSSPEGAPFQVQCWVDRGKE